jgi:drug/metabolite transporter (DMT)-like permease
VWWLQHKQKNAQPQRPTTSTLPGDGWSALASFVYAAGFSFAYLSMTAATGALLLFGAVQATMIAWGLYQGERMRKLQLGGFALAVAGLTALMLPGLATPGFGGSAAMLGAGVAWGAYSLRGRRKQTHGSGVLYAVASGAPTSGVGVGYAVWYRVLPTLQATHAATVQLSVPVIAALGGIVLLGEAVTLPMALSACAIMGGIGLVIWNKA